MRLPTFYEQNLIPNWGIDNNKLRSAGYATLMEAYLEWYPK